jgi:transcriptional/translational regulatory protein YebC/TACO1
LKKIHHHRPWPLRFTFSPCLIISAKLTHFPVSLPPSAGPGGTGFIIEALTDNVNRTAAEVRSAVTKGGGKMADAGSVLFNFTRTGLVMLDPEADEDAALEAALDAGASDMVPAKDDDGVLEGYKVLTSLEDFAAVSTNLAEQKLKLNMEASGLVYMPLADVQVSDDDFAANEGMLERLLAVDDVDAVYTNFQ